MKHLSIVPAAAVFSVAILCGRAQTVEWTISNSPGENWNKGNSLALDADGNIYSAVEEAHGVQFLSTISSITKFAPNGLPLWKREIPGGWQDRNFRCVRLGAGGSLFFAGIYDFGLTIDSFSLTGLDNGLVGRLNTQDGSVQWLKAVEGDGMEYPGFNALLVDPSGALYVLSLFGDRINGTLANATIDGVTVNARGQADSLLAKFSAQGALLWVRAIGGATDDQFDCLGFDTNGNVVLFGRCYGDVTFDTLVGMPGRTVTIPAYQGRVVAAKYDANGQLLDARVIAQGDVWAQRCSSANADGSSYLAFKWGSSPFTLMSASGATTSFNSRGNDDLVVAKYSAGWDVLWSRRIGSIGDDYLGPLMQRPSGDVILFGKCGMPGMVDDFQLPFSLGSFVAQFSANGQLQAATNVSYLVSDAAWGPTGNLFVTGGDDYSAYVSRLSITRILPVTNGVSLSLTYALVWSEADTAAYVVEEADQVDGPWRASTAVLGQVGTNRVALLEGLSPRRFYRLRRP